ncbi:GNAT family N-acetyltransferase [bacterium]|nr:GNAT family N-acetyltransferase [bacterium]
MDFEFTEFKLRKPKNKDADGLVKITHDKEAMKYYGTSGAFFKNVRKAKYEIDWFKKQFTENAGRWIIVKNNNDNYIGDIGFFNFNKSHNRAEIGYKLFKEYWGKGIITNFIKMLIDFGFTKLGYNRIEAMVDVRNEGSKIVLLRNQFKFEGTFREYEFEHGHFVDVEMYSILKKEYIK